MARPLHGSQRRNLDQDALPKEEPERRAIACEACLATKLFPTR
jgi:hypothetical protein